jgi:hypothetical protein
VLAQPIPLKEQIVSSTRVRAPGWLTHRYRPYALARVARMERHATEATAQKKRNASGKKRGIQGMLSEMQSTVPVFILTHDMIFVNFDLQFKGSFAFYTV